MRFRISLAALLAAFVAGARSTTSFSQPPGPGPAGNYRDNSVYALGERMEVQWTSDLALMDLYVWQEYPSASDSSSYLTKLLDMTRSTSLLWTVNLSGLSSDVSEGEAAILYFTVHKTGKKEIDGNCHYFNVTMPSKVTSSVTGQTTTSLSSATTSRESTGTGVPSQTPTTATRSGSSDENKLSKGAIAGIAVGAAIGGALLVAGVWLIARQIRLKNSESQLGLRRKAELPGQTQTTHPLTSPVNHGGLYEAP